MERVLTKVLVERERIFAQIERERSAITVTYGNLVVPAAALDRLLEAVRFLRTHPLAVGSLVAAFYVLRTRSVVGLAARGMGLWRLLRRLRSLAHMIGL
jgi:hypothetical protein